jgi:uncharacterized membrane-anchored protein YitT (DUF2179 family)
MILHNRITAALAGKKKSADAEKASAYQMAKSLYKYRVYLVHTIRDMFLVALGILSAGFGLEGFLLPNKFIDGGATGISLLIVELTGWSLSIILILVNIPFIFVGYKILGRNFVMKTVFGIGGLAIAILFVPYPAITSDKLLVSVFGGFFLGAGIGLAVRGGGVLDGSEVMAIFISRKTSMSIGDIILMFNIVIFSFAAWLLGIETALYSILTYLAAARTVDFIIEGVEEYTGVTIVSPKSKEISKMIAEKLGRGITVYNGRRGFGKRGHVSSVDMEIVFTVVTRLEVSRLQTEIQAIDPNAFVVMHSIKDTRGGMIKKRPLHD